MEKKLKGHMWVTWLTHVHIVAVLQLPQRMDISILWNVLEPNLHSIEYSRTRLSKQMYLAY